ncbi:carboxypeptidase-like regulatory domain-containing protein [Pedobacter frigiditerrae]|uniref:carboxypeptidase-like regulatory domain-containing protein n=1 Tax=Pedobacter frigiditerrae TaxID=2530452 RepID=UPI0029313538|nr:carboxypeptidase-like regulatory domain-containing protein [Pedobacter frigiditerrae]
MQNILPLIKDFKRIIFSLFLILAFGYNALGQSAAPQVSINVNILPPYSPYYSDYSGTNASKVLLIVRNLTSIQKRIKLTGELKGNNGIRISTKSTYIPLQPIILQPNETKQLNGAALRDVFDLNSLNVYGIDKVKLVQTSRLPEGDYTFCLQAVDMDNNQVITNTAPQGCTSVTIAYPEAPILINPSANGSVFSRTPQSVVFNWINPGFAPIGTQYVLQVAEMPLISTDPNQVLNSASFPLVNKTLNGFSYILSPADPPLIAGKRYAWRVKAIDPSGKIIFKNGGISQANIFNYSSPINLAAAPTLINPQQNAIITTIDKEAMFKWSDNAVGKTTYLLQVAEMPGSGGNAEQILSLNKFVINQTVSDLSYALPSNTPLIIGKRYAWRVSKVDPYSKTPLKGGGASQINVFSYNIKDIVEPPVLISPIANAKVTLTSPQNVTFNWDFKTKGYFRYNFQLVELATPISNPSQAFDKGVFLISKDILYANTLTITNTDALLKAGKTYAWRVRANDLGVSTSIKNDGYSTINIFDYTILKNEEKLPLAPVITSPKFAEVVAQQNDFSQPKINITWDKSNTLSPATYEIRIVKLIPGFDATSTLDNNVQVMLSYKQMLNSFTLLPPAANEDIIYARNHGRIKLEEDNTYAIQIIASGNAPDGKLLRIENLGKSNIIEFKYKGAPKPVAPAPPTPILSTIAGKLFYRFKVEGESPVKRALNFPTIKSMQQPDLSAGFNKDGTPKSYITVDSYDNNNFPSYFENNTFPIGINIHPLKNVKLNFVYVVMESQTKNPKNLKELKPYLGQTAMYTLVLNGEKVYATRDVGTTTLKEDGSFSHTFVNNYKIGYIGTDKNVSYFGFIRLIVGKHHPPGDDSELSDERYFTSPDVYALPQVGKTVTLPDDIVFVKSYNYTVRVVSDKTKDQAVNAGLPLSNYPVQMLDSHSSMSFSGPLENQGKGVFKDTSDPIDNKATMPWEADAESYAAQTYKTKDDDLKNQDLPLVAIAKTDASGYAKFTNLLIVHSHLPYVPINPLEGNFNYQSQNGEMLKGGTVGDLYAKFNSDFIIETKVAIKPIVVKPKLPEIYLRAITVQNGFSQPVPYATVHILGYTNDNFKKPVEDEYFKTDVNGYLQVKNLIANRLRTIVISKVGFADKSVAVNQNISLGQRFPESVEQVMVGAGAVVGTVVNEKGQPVMANVKVGNGPYVKTYNNGVFYIENTQSGYPGVTIAPLVDNYFGETSYPNIKPNEYTLITNNLGKQNGTIVLKEKLHRVIFKVVNVDDGKGMSSYVGVGNNTLEYFSSDPYTGLTKEFAIASPGDEFKVRVVANGFVTYEDYVKIPISKDAGAPILIQLKKAQIISGIVKDAITGAPIAGARVYTINGTNADGEVQNWTLSGVDGKYTLYGAINPKAWIDFLQSYLELPIKVYAVKSGTPGYVRSIIDASPASSNADFSLTPLDVKAEIWGLPIEVHSLVQQSYHTSIITGAFVKLPSNNSFKTTFSDAKLPFKQLAVQRNKNGFTPAVDVIDIEAASLKIMAYEKYATELIASDQENVFNKLSIKRVDSYGALTGYLVSELSNFNFSYKYTGKFLVGKTIKKPNSYFTENIPTKVFSAMPNYTTNSSYTLQALYGKSDFMVHNFKANLISGSSLSANGFDMKAEVSLNVPLLGATTLPAGSFIVTQNNIEWKQYNGNINIPLEKWAILGTGLSYDINQGGFRVVNGTLKTSLPQVSLKDLIIMPTSVDLGISKLTGNEALTLANVTPLKLASDAKMTLNYDPAAPFDQKPHYRFNLTSSGETVAYINDLPGMGNSRVNINMLSDYSDGKHKSIIVAPTKINYYNVLSQDVTGIEVADNFFTLMGNTNLEIPGAPANVTGRFKYLKNPSSQYADKNGNVLVVEKLQTEVEMEGKVKFEGNSFQLSQNNLSIEGNVLIYKNGPADAIKGIKGLLTKTPSSIEMKFLPQQKILMGEKNIEIVSGGNSVSNKKWSLVNFVGQPKNFVNTQGKSLFAAGGDLIDFQVNGAIKNTGGKGLQLDGISTPFGNLDITFDFDKASFSGTLNLVNANLPIGPVTINDANINLQIDKNGFLIVGIVTDASVTALPSCIAGGFKSGIALGYYSSPFPSYLSQKLLGVTLNSQLPSALNNGLKGFYVNVMKSLDKNALPKLPGPSLNDIPLIGSFVPVFDFSAGVDVGFVLDLDGSKTVSISGMAFANASCLYDLELCTIGLSGGATGNILLTYDNSGLGGTLSFGIEANIHFCLGQVGVKPKLVLKKDGSGFSFKPSLN